MRRHLLGLRQLDAAQMLQVLDLAQRAADGEGWPDALKGRTVVTLFYEPSTRTEISFELAGKRLGAEVVRCDVERSSVKKGESLVDSVQTLEALGADAIVLRHPSSGAPYLASRWIRCAVINAGDGMHEHPTQGLLDLLTVRQRKGRIAGLRVAIVGDILHSRVVRSAMWGFTRLGATVTLVGPPALLPRFSLYPSPLGGKGAQKIPSPLGGEGTACPEPERSEWFRGDGDGQFPRVTMTSSLEDGLQDADVVIALRLQLERQQHCPMSSPGEYARAYAVTPATLAAARPDALVMHPGPMNLGVEISAAAAYGPQSVISAQVANGVAVRMAVLLWAMGLDQDRERGNAGTRERDEAEMLKVGG